MDKTPGTGTVVSPDNLIETIRKPEFLASEDPYSVYAALREAAPLYRSTALGLWVLTRYRDVRDALRHRDATTVESLEGDSRYANSVALRQLRTAMLHVDPEAHGRLRRLVSQAFTPQTVEDLRRYVETLVDDLLDECVQRGTFDFIEDFADQIPVAVICELLGVPKDDTRMFTEWTFQTTSITGPGLTADHLARADEAMTRVLAYLSDLLAERERRPRADLLSKLISARDQDQQLTRSETLGMAWLLLAAGSDTTTAFLGGAVLALLRNPDQLHRLRSNPTLMPSAIEELLRYEGPVHFGLIRTTTEPLQLGDVEVPIGERMWTILPAANRDPEAYVEPDQLRLERKGPAHLAFGQGIHVCIGAPLARLETSVALHKFLDRFPRVERSDDANPWASHGALRRMDRLMLTGAPACPRPTIYSVP